ncbi:MAG: potassium-transporting ATPase subunit B, partial [Dolichospermum sp.]
MNSNGTNSHSKAPRPRYRPKKHRKARITNKGLYIRAIRDAFMKLHPRYAIKNPVMFLVWVGTIITFSVTIYPQLFGP